MKALIISALLFFSLRAMSAEVGESLGAENCAQTNQSAKREAKVATPVATSQDQAVKTNSISK